MKIYDNHELDDLSTNQIVILVQKAREVLGLRREKSFKNRDDAIHKLFLLQEMYINDMDNYQ